jgi:hypothetical protein
VSGPSAKNDDPVVAPVEHEEVAGVVEGDSGHLAEHLVLSPVCDPDGEDRSHGHFKGSIAGGKGDRLLRLHRSGQEERAHGQASGQGQDGKAAGARSGGERGGGGPRRRLGSSHGVTPV